MQLIFIFLSLSAGTTTERVPRPFFRRRYGYTSTTTTKIPKSSTSIPDIIRTEVIESGRSSSDQELEPSLVDKKFSHSNQIDIGSDVISQGLAEAITSISRAPLPFVSTTVRHVKITTPGSIKYDNDDDDLDYQISKRADSISGGGKKTNSRFSIDENAQIRLSSGAKPVQQRLIASTTSGPIILVTNSPFTQDSQARPSREFKRTQKLIRNFSNLNADPNAKTSATLKEKPKKTSFRPAADYDYYDDGDSIIGKSTSKVTKNLQ